MVKTYKCYSVKNYTYPDQNHIFIKF